MIVAKVEPVTLRRLTYIPDENMCTVVIQRNIAQNIHTLMSLLVIYLTRIFQTPQIAYYV